MEKIIRFATRFDGVRREDVVSRVDGEHYKIVDVSRAFRPDKTDLAEIPILLDAPGVRLSGKQDEFIGLLRRPRQNGKTEDETLAEVGELARMVYRKIRAGGDPELVINALLYSIVG